MRVDESNMFTLSMFQRSGKSGFSTFFRRFKLKCKSSWNKWAWWSAVLDEILRYTTKEENDPKFRLIILTVYLWDIALGGLTETTKDRE